MSKLNDIIEYVCNEHANNDTQEFYTKIILCCYECLELIDKSLLTEDERCIIRHGINTWRNSTIDTEKLNNLMNLFLHTYSKEACNKQRENVIQAVLCTLMTYGKWYPQEYERVNALEYFVFYLQNSGVAESSIYPIIKKHFPHLA